MYLIYIHYNPDAEGVVSVAASGLQCSDDQIIGESRMSGNKPHTGSSEA